MQSETRHPRRVSEGCEAGEESEVCEERNIVMSDIQRIPLKVIFPLMGFILIALWSQRVLLGWLVFGLVALTVVALITIQLIRTITEAKVQLDEEASRLERLRANEQLVRQTRIASPNGWRRQKLANDYDGLAPITMEKDEKWS